MAKRYKYSKMWQVLKEAKKYLNTELSAFDNQGENNYICHAVEDVAKFGDCSYNLASKVGSYVQNQLGLSIFLQGWIVNNYPDLGVEVFHDRAYNKGRKMQTTRHLWVDHMVKTLKEKNL